MNQTQLDEQLLKEISESILEDRTDKIKTLLDLGANAKISKAIICAASYCSKEVVQLLVEYGADVNADTGVPILYAATNGKLETIKYLIEAGADILVYNSRALENAERAGHLEVVKVLVENGCDIEQIKYTSNENIKSYYKAYTLDKKLNTALKTNSLSNNIGKNKI